MLEPDVKAWLRLCLTPRIGRATARRLLAALGTPEQLLQAGPAAWEAVAGAAAARALSQPTPELDDQLEHIQQWLAADPRHHIVTLADPHYPAALLQTSDPPLLLYALGHLSALQHPRPLAMVGSRNPTAQGAENARAFARQLAEQGLAIVSGLALGIDGAAHQGALDARGTTIAVVGTGLDRVYPKRHLTLAQQVAEQGLLLSEYPPGTAPLTAHFPQRNRIIAGLSLGTLVVEAALESGSLITAQLATDMGREVFAIPGSIHAPQSRGCHALIRQGAKLVESAQDILDELHLERQSPGPVGPASAQASASPATAHPAVLQALGFEPTSLDALQARTGLGTPTLQAELLTLELNGQVQRLPGGVFQRCGLG